VRLECEVRSAKAQPFIWININGLLKPLVTHSSASLLLARGSLTLRTSSTQAGIANASAAGARAVTVDPAAQLLRGVFITSGVTASTVQIRPAIKEIN
jgi:hypothetical protein